MRQSIFVGERLERNLRALFMLGVIVAAGGAVMTTINIVQHKGFVTYTTAVIVLFGLLIVYGAKVLRNRRVVNIAIMLIALLTLTYYSISGVNEGFAILWTLLIPVAVSFLSGALDGLILSSFFEILFIVLFYTPIREHMVAYYTETFMNRFPVLYLVGIFVNLVAVSNYHLSTLSEMEYEKKLKDAADAAIAADKAKGRFLAQMSHEIRTPINAVLGMNEMIIREADNPEIEEYADNIQTAGRNLLSIINTILDFSKIEDGKMEIIPVEYDFPSVCNNLVNSVASRAKAKGLEFKVNADNNLPTIMYGDDVRITQVIMNLLTNAVKYTENGSVTLSVNNAGMDGEDIFIDVEVADTGIGIKQEDMGKLFESFGRLEERRNRGIEGTGLGMAIVTKLLEMMGSELKVESVYGEGSKFSFRLRQGVVDDTPIGDFAEHFSKTGRQERTGKYIYAPKASVLLVDDNDMNCKVARNLMKRNGIEPDMVYSGQEAIARIREKFYHIVFLDHMMPKMDGVETLRKLKEESLVPEGTSIIVLTANAVVGAKENYLAEGFDDYLSKPIDVEALEERLSKYLPEELTEWRYLSDEASHYHRAKGSPEKTSEDVMEFSPGGDDDILEFAPAENETEKKQSADIAGDVISNLSDKGYDTSAALKYCAGDRDFYIEMLGDFVKVCSAKSAELDGYYSGSSLREYQTLVHSMKSATKTLGAAKVSEMAAALEKASKENDKAYLDAHHEGFLSAYGKMGAEIAAALKIIKQKS